MKSIKIYLFLFLTFVFLLSCSKDTSSTDNGETNDLDKISIRYLNGEGNADFMPPVVPDPIHIKIEIEFKNLSGNQTIKDIDFEDEKVFLQENDSLLGVIDLSSWEEIILFPHEIDTVTLAKTRCDSIPFEAPDKRYIYLEFDIVDKYGNILKFKTDSIYFECSY